MIQEANYDDPRLVKIEILKINLQSFYKEYAYGEPVKKKKKKKKEVMKIALKRYSLRVS